MNKTLFSFSMCSMIILHVLIYSFDKKIIISREEGHMQKAMQEAGCKGFDVILENRACLNLNIDMKSLRELGRIAVMYFELLIYFYDLHVNKHYLLYL